MKTNESTIFVFIASIIIGVLISTSINFRKINNMVFLTPAEYQEAYENTDKLNSDISKLSKKYDEYYNKLQTYKNYQNENSLLAEVNKEIANNEMILGNTDVEGEGVVIELDDGTEEVQGEVIDPSDLWIKTVHDTDVINVVEALKIAGAEVISVNDLRITDNSYILCWGPFILVDGVKVPSPFNIKAIGDKEKIFSYMISDGGYLSYLKIRGIKLNIYREDKIQILGNDKKSTYTYMKEVKDK